MSLPHISVAAITNPQFINLQPSDISPLISKCEIKVLYVGSNRNGSIINKDTAEQMSKTLRGCPIVGYFKSERQDFRDHGNILRLEEGDLVEECLTKPYGFIPTDARVWFKFFEDLDEKGNTIVREYLMTEGYLWTEQYEEAKLVYDGGRPQSMELDDGSLKGEWIDNYNNTGIEYFIINDAIFTKLCILGEDVEPCFEGSSITAPDISTSFSLNEDLLKSLFTMIQDISNILKGGTPMPKDETILKVMFDEGDTSDAEGGTSEAEGDTSEADQEAEAAAEAAVAEAEAAEALVADTDVESDIEDIAAGILGSPAEGETAPVAPTLEGDTGEILAEQVINSVNDVIETLQNESLVNTEEQVQIAIAASEKPDATEAADASVELAKQALQDVKDAIALAIDNLADSLLAEKTVKAIASDIQSSDGAAAKKSFELEELQKKYDALEAECKELRAFKLSVEDKEKDALINKFSMISDKDKAEIIKNKSSYTLDEINAKLSVLYVEKHAFKNELGVDEPSVQPVTTFSLDNDEAEELPAWLRAVKRTRDSRN